MCVSVLWIAKKYVLEHCNIGDMGKSLLLYRQQNKCSSYIEWVRCAIQLLSSAIRCNKVDHYFKWADSTVYIHIVGNTPVQFVGVISRFFIPSSVACEVEWHRSSVRSCEIKSLAKGPLFRVYTCIWSISNTSFTHFCRKLTLNVYKFFSCILRCHHWITWYWLYLINKQRAVWINYILHPHILHVLISPISRQSPQATLYSTFTV